jgi:ABC-type glycerol-3-phosphate transport system substrate-binding protein
MIERFEAAVPGTRVAVAEPVEAGDLVAMFLGDDPPALARVPFDAVAALARVGAIRPIDNCVDDRLVADGELDAARQLGLVEDVRYGVAGNVDAVLMLYDAAAFQNAGLDPTSPPAMWSELRDAAVALRDQAGIAHPIANLSLAVTLADDAISDALSSSARAWLALQADGLLLDAHDASAATLPPLGDGRAAIEFVHVDGLWGYAASLAAGQAPDADLRIAAAPGAAGGRVPIGGDVWVLSARATPDESALASTLLAWLIAAPQQASLHTVTDLFPTSSSAGADPAAVGYWAGLPLLADAWEHLAQAAAAPAGWMTTPGAGLAVNVTLPAGDGDTRSAQQRWAALTAALDASQTVDPAELLACVYPPHELPQPITSCIPSTNP